ncbi:unnamed protein product [Somion occarium]|uniref:DH domain-containing protein n=1 Tax=Somion occarium TaxID=3059160 RepID=A0ABP1DK51_9APHY
MNGIDEGLSEPLNSILVEEIAKIFDDYPSRLQQQSLYFVCCDALRFIQVANHTTIVACLRSRVPTSFPKLAACSARYCQISPNPWRRELRNQSYLELCDILAGRCISDGHEADPNTKLQLQVLFSEFFSQSTSLYQQCSVLRARLMRIQNFPQYFTLSSKDNASSSRRSTDPVTQLWDCFALGVPLCYLFNLLPPPIQPVPIDTASFDPTNDMIINRALVMFEAGVRQIEGCPKFTMTDLWDRNSTDGFVRVVNIVSTVVTNIPEDIFTESPHTYPPTELFTWLLHSARSTDRQPGANIAKELLYTERKYVQDLETMQWTLGQGAFLLGMNLDSLIDFHRRFLIKLESISDSPWMDGGWGNAFTEFEEEFSVYESYCVNYTNASDNLSLSEENSLVALDGLLNIKSELSAFLIMPAQRVGKYPLLLESLIKAVMNTNYSHLDELKQGLAAAKRIADKVNEEKRRAENRAAVKRLEGRVDDWRGHHVSNFGTVLLDDVFTITKSDIDREYHVFLFEKIILCFRELFPSTNGKKAGKSNGLLKTPGSPWPINISSPNLSKRGTPLLLKGRIYLQNVTSVIPKIHAGRYSLAVYWKGDHDIEYFTLRCRNEEQLRLWENSLVRLLADIAARRTTDSL